MKKFLLIFVMIIFTSCVTDNPPQIIDSARHSRAILQEVEDAVYEEPKPREFAVFFRESEAAAGKYEPLDGAYVGAWLTDDTSIRGYEHRAERSHAVYVNEINLGDELPVSWILHCIASLATPLIAVNAPSEENETPAIELIITLARRAGAFNLPIFIAFYPDTLGISAEEYTALYRFARHVFNTHAPMTAFVWVSPSHAATPQNAFYPGHAAVDWVALPLFADWNERDGFTDILHNFENFYFEFHEHKPIMILPLGISHFTRGDYRYRLSEAAEEITRVYNALMNFPRLGLIVYGDAFTLQRAYSDDFSVTIENELFAAYKNIISREFFLSAIERTPSSNSRWVRAAQHAYVLGDEISFANDESISEKNISVCEERRVIFVIN
jgi:hypothetical protein